MAPAFSLGPIDHANRALEQSGWDRLTGRRIAQVEPELRHANVMKQFFVAMRQCWSNAFSFGRFIPVVSRSHRSVMGAETDQECVIAELFPDQLTHIPFTAVAHLSRTRVAQVRVVG